MAWFDEQRGAPTWEPPVLPELSDEELVWHAPAEARWSIRSHPQEILENAVDIAHFRFVHGVTSFGALATSEHGPMLRARAELTLNTPRGVVEGAVENELWGLGIDINRVIGIGKAVAVLTVTPVDGDEVDLAFFFLSAGAADAGRLSSFAKGHVRDTISQIEADFPIWEHKVHRANPSLAVGERSILDFRRWAGQFYATSR
jgi:hypothetical protein